MVHKCVFLFLGVGWGAKAKKKHFFETYSNKNATGKNQIRVERFVFVFTLFVSFPPNRKREKKQSQYTTQVRKHLCRKKLPYSKILPPWFLDHLKSAALYALPDQRFPISRTQVYVMNLWIHYVIPHMLLTHVASQLLLPALHTYAQGPLRLLIG